MESENRMNEQNVWLGMIQKLFVGVHYSDLHSTEKCRNIKNVTPFSSWWMHTHCLTHIACCFNILIMAHRGEHVAEIAQTNIKLHRMCKVLYEWSALTQHIIDLDMCHELLRDRGEELCSLIMLESLHGAQCSEETPASIFVISPTVCRMRTSASLSNSGHASVGKYRRL